MHYRQPWDKVKNFVSVPRYYQAVTGACMLVRRDDFYSVGGFNEEFLYSFEDIDLCLQMKRKCNKLCIFCSDSILIHDEGISKTQPNLQHNIKTFIKNCKGLYINDLEFYLSNDKHMKYKKKY
jgi:GT2 family glycosyltransferase